MASTRAKNCFPLEIQPAADFHDPLIHLDVPLLAKVSQDWLVGWLNRAFALGWKPDSTQQFASASARAGAEERRLNRPQCSSADW